MEIRTDADEFASQFADEVFAEMSRHRYTNKDLAEVLKVTAHTAGTRINKHVPFNVIEMNIVALWLEIDLEELVRRAKSAGTRPKAAAA